MTTPLALWQIVKALPEIIKLIENIQAAQTEKQVQSKVADDLKEINEAFKNKDADRLNALFKSV